MGKFNNNQMNEDELIQKGYKKYTGKEMNVYFNGNICIHAAECVRGNSSVFNPQRRPWIKVDEASPDEIKNIISLCPSGALQYEKE